jgi:hypothetical protein
MWATLRRLGLAISYFVSIVYIVSILLPSVYCLRQGCRGPAELDAFMPAFGLTPFGAIATASHCTMPYSTSGKDSHGLGFSGLSQSCSQLFSWV